MKRIGLLAAFALAACSTGSLPKSDADRMHAAIAQITEAVARDPRNGALMYVAATYHDRLGAANDVVRWLDRLDGIAWTLGVNPRDFKTNTAEFRAVAARLNAREPLVAKATVAFTIAQRDLIPEGIAYDPVDRAFYVSSLYRRKIVRVDADGSVRDFVGEAQDGILATLGMKVDATRRILWVCSGTTPEMRGYTADSDGTSYLFAYDLDTGKLVRKLSTGSKDDPAFLNDLAILDDGNVVITDTNRSMLMTISGERLVPWLDARPFRYPNGIAMMNGSLYVADFRGITQINLSDKSQRRLQSAETLNGIDGLSAHDGALIGIQNAVGNPRVIRMRLDGDRANVEILESKNPYFDFPTTGVVAGGAFYFMANPQLRAFDEKQQIRPNEKLKDVVVLRIGL